MPSTRHVPHAGGPKHVGVRDFRTNLTAYLEAGEPLVISNKGKTVGYFSPALKLPTKAALQKAERAMKTSSDLAKRLGITEQEIEGA